MSMTNNETESPKTIEAFRFTNLIYLGAITWLLGHFLPIEPPLNGAIAVGGLLVLIIGIVGKLIRGEGRKTTK